MVVEGLVVAAAFDVVEVLAAVVDLGREVPELVHLGLVDWP